MNRRFVTPLAVLVPLLALAGIATNVKVPYVALGPGPTFDTLGEADGKPVVQIDGIEPDTTTGQLRMTTVGVNDRLTLAQALTVWISDRYALAPRETVYPPNVSKDDVRAADHLDRALIDRVPRRPGPQLMGTGHREEQAISQPREVPGRRQVLGQGRTAAGALA